MGNLSFAARILQRPLLPIRQSRLEVLGLLDSLRDLPVSHNSCPAENLTLWQTRGDM